MSAVFIAFMLAFRSGDRDEKPRTMVTLTELGVFVPSGWQYREVNGAYVMAQYKEDLDVEEPENLRGPQLRMRPRAPGPHEHPARGNARR